MPLKQTMEKDIKNLQWYRSNEDFIDFSHNWNGKLNCTVFTTIRIYNAVRFSPGLIKTVRLKESKLKTVKIISCIPKFPLEFNDHECLMDTGLSKRKTINLIREMYKNKLPMIDTVKFCLVTFETIEVFRKAEQATIDFNF